MLLKGKRVAVLVAEQYQDLEVWYPVLRLREEGARVVIVGTGSASEYKGKFGYPIKADTAADKAKSSDFDAVVIPGGWAPDFLRRYRSVCRFVSDMNREKKVVAAICHAGSVLVSAGILKGRTATAFKAVKDDMVYAGANFVDREVVRDGNLITSRTPDDLPAFMREIISALQKRSK